MHLFSLLGYRGRWRLRSLLPHRRVSQTSPIVIGGCERSGTTLLRVLLGRHPEIGGGAGLESTVFQKRITSPSEIGRRYGFEPALIERWQRESRSQVEFIEKFQAAVLAQEKKPLWLEKTPQNVLRFSFIRRHFPKARLIHVVRDGRDAVCSLRQQSWVKARCRRDPVEELRLCAAYWARRVVAGRRFAAQPRYFELRYEDLVQDPEGVLRRVLEFLGLEWSEALLRAEDHVGPDPHERRARGAIDEAAVGIWRERVQPAERPLLCGLIGDLLVELGYERDHAWGGHAPSLARGYGKRWTRLQRAGIETGAVLRTVRDPRFGWWPRIAGTAIAIGYLAILAAFVPDPPPLLGLFLDVLVLPISVGPAAMLAPALLREKRGAVKRWYRTHSASRIWSAWWPAPRLAVQRRSS